MTVTVAGWLVIAASLLLASGLMCQPWLRRRRLRMVAEHPVDAGAEAHLESSVSCWPRLTSAQRDRLLKQVRIFLHEKQFHGCAGLRMNDRMRGAVAANACLLRLQPGADCFPAVRHILLYPRAFWVRHDFPDEHGLVDEQGQLLAGEAWDAGRVVLSWEDCEAGIRGDADNVIVHEFAHQLDYEATGADGAPPLADYAEWSRVFSEEFARLQTEGSTVIDAYGATSPAEFLAVSAEAFFQRGDQLAAEHGALYDLLARYFELDTTGRQGA